MKVTIQAVKARESNVNKLLKELPSDTIVYYDLEMRGPFHSFKQMLSIPFEGYRLHLQDDVVLAENFQKYLPFLESEMMSRKFDVLALYVPNRKHLVESYHAGIQYRKEKNLGFPAIIFSKFAIELLKDQIKSSSQQKDDDAFFWEAQKRTGLKSWIHLPSIVQHNIALKSSLKHANNTTRMSPIFEYDWITKNYGKKL